MLKRSVASALFIVISCLLVVRHAPAADEALAGHASVPAGTLIDKDFFSLAEVVDVSGTVNGDVYAAGREVRVSGTINGDLIAAGEMITVSGRVAHDARVAGKHIVVTGEIGKNVTAGAKSIEFTDSSRVGGGIIAGAESMAVSGPVGRDLKVAATDLTLSGTVSGDVDAAVEAATVTSGARISGRLTYWSRHEVRIEGGAAVEGGVKWIRKPMPAPAEEQKPLIPTGRLITTAFSFAIMLSTGLLIIKAFPAFNRKVVSTISSRPLASLGIGFVSLVMLPATAIMLLLTVIGIPLSLMLLVAYAVWVYVSRLFAALLGGSLLLDRTGKGGREGWSLLVGLLIFYILAAVPYFGVLVNIAAMLLGLGAAVLAMAELYRKAREGGLI